MRSFRWQGPGEGHASMFGLEEMPSNTWNLSIAAGCWKRFGILCAFLIFSTSAMAHGVGVTPSIGFAYYVPGFSEIGDAGAYQYSFVNRQIYRDFAVMSSLGVKVIKIPISI